MIVTLYRGAKQAIPERADDFEWPDFVAALAEIVQDVSGAAPGANHKAQKAALLAFSPVELSRPYRLAVNVKAITLLVIDVDGFAIEPVIESIERLGIAAVVYGSPSDDAAKPARRFRVVSPITRPIDPSDSARTRYGFAELLGIPPGVGVEGATSPEKIFFAGRVHDAPEREWLVFDGTPVDVDALLAEPLVGAWIGSAAAAPSASACAPAGSLAHAEAVAERRPAAVDGIEGGKTTLVTAIEIGRITRDESVTLDVLRRVYNPRCLPQWSEEELAHKARDAHAKIADSEARIAPVAKAMDRVHGTEATEPVGFPVLPLASNKNGPLRTIDNVCLCIDTWIPGKLRLEVTRGRIVCGEIDPSLHLPDGTWTEEHTIELTRLCEQHGLLVGPQTVGAAVKSYAKRHQFNAIADRLETAALAWDGRPRVDTALTRLWGGEDCEAVRIASRILFLSLAARGTEPGCQADYCITFVGDQGKRKSTSWRALIGNEWFSSSELPIGNKDAHMQMRGKLLWEFAERAGVSQRDRNQTKQFITDPWATYRAAYGQFSEDVPRLTVFVATTNDEEFLDDPTGNRRFPCVRVVRGADCVAITAEREQLLGEAAARVIVGRDRHPNPYARPAEFTWWPTDAEEAVLDAYRAPHIATDPWDESLELWAEKQKEPFPLLLALTLGVGVEVSRLGRREMLRGASTLRRLGFEQCYVNGRKRWRRE